MFWPFNHYPGSDYETFNYDWIIGKLKELKDSVAAALASEQAAAESADEAHGSMLAATAQAAHAKTYAEHAADSAHESADSAASIAGVVDQVNTNTGRIENLIATAGDGTIPSELTDIRVGQNGMTYTTAGAAVRSNDFLDRKAAEIAAYNWQALRNGEPLTAYTGFSYPGTITAGAEEARTDKKEYITPFFSANDIDTIIVEAGFRVMLFWYDSEENYQTGTTQQWYAGTHNVTKHDGLYRAKVNTTDWAVMSPEQAANAFTLIYSDRNSLRLDYLTTVKNSPALNDFELTSNNTRLTSNVYYINNESDVIVESDYKTWYSFFIETIDPATGVSSTLTGWEWYYKIPRGVPFKITMRRSNDTSIENDVLTVYNHFAVTPVNNINGAETVKKVNAAKKLFNNTTVGTGSTLTNFAHLTDIHTDQARWSRFNKFVNDNNISAVLATGDYVEDPSDAEITIANNMFSEMTKPYYAALGNHDILGHSTTLTNAQVLNKYRCFPDGLYYSKVIDNIMLIVLNQYADENGTTRYTQTQMTWFCEQMQQANEAGYHVMILMHEPEYMPVVNDKGFYQRYPKSNINFNNPICNGMIQTVINSFINGADINESYNGLAAVASFPNEGIFIGIVCGHMHRDFTGYASQFTNQLILIPVSGCASVRVGDNVYEYTNLADLDRNIHTGNQDAFNVYSIDTDNRVVKIVRVGANYNDMLEPRMVATFNY